MSDRFDKLKGHSDVKQNINRRDAQQGDIIGNDGKKLEKRINDIRKVIADPDVWNVNIASRERMERLEERMERLEERLVRLEEQMNQMTRPKGSSISPALQKLLDQKRAEKND